MTINPKEITLQALQAYLQNAIAPRPIAFASTVDKEGQVNLSPFSFFNLFGTNPPTLIFAPNRRVRDGSQKHTILNILEHDEVVINLVDYSMVQQMSLASCEYEKGVNEFVKAGFTEEKSLKVKPPRVRESKAQFECKVKQVIQMGETGGAANLVICEVILMHFSEDILDESGKIDIHKTDWVARMGGDSYCRASGNAIFEVPKPSINKGIGFDQLPLEIRQSNIFTANDLGILANIEHLPENQLIEEHRKQKKGEFTGKSREEIHHIARNLLRDKKVTEAWLTLLS